MRQHANMTPAGESMVRAEWRAVDRQLYSRAHRRPDPLEQPGHLERVILSRLVRVILVGTREIEQEKAYKSRKYHRTLLESLNNRTIDTCKRVLKLAAHPAVIRDIGPGHTLHVAVAGNGDPVMSMIVVVRMPAPVCVVHRASFVAVEELNL